MSNCMHEAVLYGDLVKHLREMWAEEAAQFNETSLAEEQKRIDGIIRGWFFTPQSELSGLTPQRMIRDEEQGKPSIVPHDHLDDIFHDDCPSCRAMKNGPLADAEWHIGLAPDMTLLDEYDSEGYEAKWKPALDAVKADDTDSVDEDIDLDEETTDAPPKEARTWLMQNPNNRCFAGNRFYDRQEALDFVNRLYELGALMILVDNIFDEPYRIREQGGPYADTLQVYLPPDEKQQADLRAIFEHELLERQGLDLKQYTFEDVLVFWWD